MGDSPLASLAATVIALGVSLWAVAIAFGARRSADGAHEQLREQAQSRAKASPAPGASFDPRELQKLTDRLGVLEADFQELAKETFRELDQIRMVAGAPSRTGADAAAGAAAGDEVEPAAMGPGPGERDGRGTEGRPVELNGEYLIASQSLAAFGALVPGGAPGAPARVYVNEDVEIDHVALEKWGLYFDFQGGKPYQRYRTVKPSLVRWDEAEGRGRVIEAGVAQAV
ncbi:MAG: hypothetical protein WKG32_14520 [Gemmatimonadaceae bacterium]